MEGRIPGLERLGQRAFVILKDLTKVLSSYTPLPSSLSMGEEKQSCVLGFSN